MDGKGSCAKCLSALLLFGLNCVVASRIELGSVEIMLTRTLIGAALLAAIFALSQVRGPGTGRACLARGGRRPSRWVRAWRRGFSWLRLFEEYRQVGVGCCFYFSSIGNLPVHTIAIYGYLEPLSAVAFAALFLGERMDLMRLAGAALILGGAAFVKLQRPRRAPTAEDAGGV